LEVARSAARQPGQVADLLGQAGLAVLTRLLREPDNTGRFTERTSRIILVVRPITGNRDGSCPWRLFVIGRPAPLAALPQSDGPLFDRAAAVFEADERVRAMWLHGALARGKADAASDMDISVAIADDGFAASWRDWLAQAVRDYLRQQGAPLPGRAG
jgi:hypothetical protein